MGERRRRNEWEIGFILAKCKMQNAWWLQIAWAVRGWL